MYADIPGDDCGDCMTKLNVTKEQMAAIRKGFNYLRAIRRTIMEEHIREATESGALEAAEHYMMGPNPTLAEDPVDDLKFEDDMLLYKGNCVFLSDISHVECNETLNKKYWVYVIMRIEGNVRLDEFKDREEAAKFAERIGREMIEFRKRAFSMQLKPKGCCEKSDCHSKE